MTFLTAKQVYLNLGISATTLYKRIYHGHYPPLETGGKRKGGKGYSQDLFDRVQAIVTPSHGRPKNV
jgi:hypothetical protein